MEQAVLDRFEGDKAVLLVGDERRVLDVPRNQLPLNVQEGVWLQISIEDGKLTHAALDQESTDTARQRIAAKLERLRRGEHLDPK